jgi:amidohydrolase
MDPKSGARERLESAQEQLIELSHRIHANPELGFEEELASTWLSEQLEAAGFHVESGICDLPTAFSARIGSGPLHLAICAEYDCLPEVGHACGHNIIAASSLGTALALATVADEVGLTVSVIGTPAEEGGGGKILLLQRGAFEGMHAAMMVHPTPNDLLDPLVIAAASFDVSYKGKESHAALAPYLGINAGDALTIAQTAIGLLRQQLRPTELVHGIVTHGGEAPNIIPAHTRARYMVRAETMDELEPFRQRVMHCFEAGALATGATMEVSELHATYAEMRHDPLMAAVYHRNAEALGRRFATKEEARNHPFSTDMGNISLALPSIHPTIGIGSLPAVNHQPEFAAHCVTESADQALLDGALALAWTAIDLAMDPALRDRLIQPTLGQP